MTDQAGYRPIMTDLGTSPLEVLLEVRPLRSSVLFLKCSSSGCYVYYKQCLGACCAPRSQTTSNLGAGLA